MRRAISPQVQPFALVALLTFKAVYPTRFHRVGVRLFATAGAALVNSLRAWNMAAIWPTE